jgi:hypothetical protein
VQALQLQHPETKSQSRRAKDTASRRPIQPWMQTEQSRRTYDHRIKEAIVESEN